jgi:hypothetical protein
VRLAQKICCALGWREFLKNRVVLFQRRRRNLEHDVN